jgi:hypothetical protein
LDEHSGAIADKRSAWIAPLMEWSAVQRVRARLKNSIDHVPDEIGGVPLSNASRQLYAWWLEARGSREMPAPEDVDPRALVELLPYIRYMCWENEKTLIFRIFGSALVEGYGLDFTGLSVFGPAEHADSDMDRARLHALHIQPCGILIVRDVYDKTGRAYPCEFMTLPISPDSEGKARVIGTVVPCEQVPEWAVDVELNRILPLRRAVFIDTGCGVPNASLGLCK